MVSDINKAPFCLPYEVVDVHVSHKVDFNSGLIVVDPQVALD